MQKAIIVRYRYHEDRRNSALRELNEMLADGWRMVNAVPMNGVPVPGRTNSGLTAIFAALVILEK